MVCRSFEGESLVLSVRDRRVERLSGMKEEAYRERIIIQTGERSL